MAMMSFGSIASVYATETLDIGTAAGEATSEPADEAACEILPTETGQIVEQPIEQPAIVFNEINTIVPVPTPVAIEKEGLINFEYLEYYQNVIHAAPKWENHKETPIVGSEYNLQAYIPVVHILYDSELRVYGIDPSEVLSPSNSYTAEKDYEDISYLIIKNPKEPLKIIVPDNEVKVTYYTSLIPHLKIYGQSRFLNENGLGDCKAPKRFTQQTLLSSFQNKIYYPGDNIYLIAPKEYEGFSFDKAIITLRFLSSTNGTLKSKELPYTSYSRSIGVRTELLDGKYAAFNSSELIVTYNYKKLPDPTEEPSEPEQPTEPEQPINDEPTDSHHSSSSSKKSSSSSNQEIVNIEDEDVPLAEVLSDFAYVMGYPDGTFRSEGNITRAEIAAIFSRILKLDTNSDLNNNYTDIKDSHWAKGYILSLTNKGIFDEGYEDQTFRPDTNITRGELAKVITDYLEFKGVTLQTDNTDYSDISNNWAKEAIEKVSNYGILKGYEDKTFRPDDYASRLSVVYMVNELTERAPLNSAPQTFSDITTNNKDYKQIQKAALNHIYTNLDNGECQFIELVTN